MQNPVISFEHNTCYVTLTTRPSYLPGILILAYTLDQHNSRYPLVVQYTDGLGEEAIEALKEEAARRGRIIARRVESLVPRAGQENTGAIAERFQDTFTKLRAFQLYQDGYTRACFVDADMAVFSNPDTVFDDCNDLPQDWLAATHNCVCSQDGGDHVPKTWHKGNCAYTALTSGSQVNDDTSSRPTYALLNGGLFVFHPSNLQWTQMMNFFDHAEGLKHYRFPDQDFLSDFFRGRWKSISWKYNAMKTNRYLHPVLWSDLVILHYIVDKPWERQVSEEGIGGFLGRDGEAHQRWWNYYNAWEEAQPLNSKCSAIMKKLCNTQEPFTKARPILWEAGRLEDIKPYEGGPA